MKRIIIVCLLCALLLACVPTPEEVVAGKGGGAAALISEEPDGQLLALLSAVPSAWNDAFPLRDGTVTVKIDAAVDVPDAERFPIVEVAPAPIDPAVAAKLLNRLVPRGSLRIPNPDGQMYTVEDVDRWIDEVKALLAHTDELSFASVEERDAYIDTQNIELERLFALRKTAEEGAVTTLDDYAMLRHYGAMQCRVLDARGNECAEVLWKPQSGDTQDKRESVLQIDALSPACALADGEVETVAEAQQLADALVEEIGLSGRYACVSVRDGKNRIACYYGPTCGGIAASPFTETVLDADSYRAPWPNEALIISFNRNDGRTSVSYVCPSVTLGELGNASLLPFEEIRSQFEKTVKSSYAWMDDGIVSAEITVTRVSLGYYRVPMKDAQNRYIMIPAWTFEGTRTTTEHGDGADGLFVNENDLPNNVLLILSGVDGSLLYAG